jgi:hypothetical protein
MQKIKLVDGKVYEIKSIEIVKGNLEIVIADMTAEEVQEIFSDKANLSTITMLTESGEESGAQYGFVCYSGLYMSDNEKRVILTKEADKDAERITSAEARAVAALARVEELEAENIVLKEEMTVTQMALCEIYESIGGE